jgi:hypothetical protein
MAMKCKNKIIFGLAASLIFVIIPALSFAAVALTAECAYDNDLAKAVCVIYANSGADTLISGGVGLEYDTNELTLQSAQKNEDEWFFGDGTPEGNFPYMDPEDVELAGSKKAVLTVVGKLNESAPTEGIAGDRIEIVRTEFAIVGSSKAPYDLTLGLAREGNYENFVSVNGDLLDDGITQLDVLQAEAGDANANGQVDAVDAQIVSGIFFGTEDDRIFADCNLDGKIDAVDAQCISEKFFGN